MLDKSYEWRPPPLRHEVDVCPTFNQAVQYGCLQLGVMPTATKQHMKHVDAPGDHRSVRSVIKEPSCDSYPCLHIPIHKRVEKQRPAPSAKKCCVSGRVNLEEVLKGARLCRVD